MLKYVIDPMLILTLMVGLFPPCLPQASVPKLDDSDPWLRHLHVVVIESENPKIFGKDFWLVDWIRFLVYVRRP